jgi:hypothetical protein
VSSPLSPLVDHAEVKRRINALAADKSGLFRVRQTGTSLERREIWDVTFGTGPFVVLMWSQMHGDEATAISALFDVYEYLRRHRDEPAVKQLLGAITKAGEPHVRRLLAEAAWAYQGIPGLDASMRIGKKPYQRWCATSRGPRSSA